MPTYRCTLKSPATLTQLIEIEADDADDARDLVLHGDGDILDEYTTVEDDGFIELEVRKHRDETEAAHDH